MPESGCEDAPGPAYSGSDSRSGKQCGTRETLPAPAHPALPLSRVGRILESPWQAQSKGLWPRRSRKGQPCPGCSHCAPTHSCKASVTPYPQILLAPCPDPPPPPYTAPNCGQVSLQERWHHPSTYFSMRILPLFQDGEEEEAPYTLLPRDTGKHQWFHHRYLCFTVCFQGDLTHNIQRFG